MDVERIQLPMMVRANLLVVPAICPLATTVAGRVQWLEEPPQAESWNTVALLPIENNPVRDDGAWRRHEEEGQPTEPWRLRKWLDRRATIGDILVGTPRAPFDENSLLPIP